jgi:hypothetical protein
MPGKDWILSGLVVTRVCPHIGHVPAPALRPGESATLSATVTGPEEIGQTVLWYRFSREADFRMALLNQLEPHVYETTLPVPIDAQELAYYYAAEDTVGNTTLFPAGGAGSPLVVPLGATTTPPEILHQPVRSFEPGKPLCVRAQVQSPEPLRTIRLRYRGLNQREPVLAVDMVASGGWYEATIPAPDLVPRWDLLYFIEAIDRLGNWAGYPDISLGMPYIIAHPYDG